jgi:cardiolipin synthase
MTQGAPEPLRIATIPNLLSALRLLGVPLFLWLLLGPHADGWALVVLALSAVTDWADGKIARWLHQYSRLGELLDPAADRLYILATLVAFVIRGFIPWWVAALIVGRDVVLAVAIPLIRRHGYPPLPVLYLGKAATFSLLYAFPILLLARAAPGIAGIAQPVGLAFMIWGVAMYLWVGALYLSQVVRIVRHTPVVPRERRPTARSLTGG